MKRRTYLVTLGAGVTSLAGCTALSKSPAENSSETPPPTTTNGGNPSIVDRHFKLVDYDERFESGSYDFEERFQHAAEVHFDTETSRVVVVGRLQSGSRSCMETVLESATYDSTSDTLTVIVFDDFDESAEVCTSEIAVVPYEATVTFDSGVPETVVVKHRNDGRGIVFTETFTS